MVHGAAGSAELGRKLNMWSPAAAGSDFDLAPTSLASLEPYREYLTVVSNTMAHAAEAWAAPEVGGDHFRSSTVYLTQRHPKQTEGSDIHAGVSLDQVYAKRYGQDSAIPSMQLCIEAVDQAGGCDYGYACVYTDYHQWASPTEPLPSIRDPRAVFNQLFGVGDTAQDRADRRKLNASILDWVTGQIADVRRQLGSGDRHRLDGYLSDVREIERRIQNIEAHNSSGEPRRPAGSADWRPRRLPRTRAPDDGPRWRLAFQADLTRVFSLKMSRDGFGPRLPGSGVDAGFHPSVAPSGEGGEPPGGTRRSTPTTSAWSPTSSRS